MSFMINEIIGKFHPLVVHLPIGFITLTLILVMLSKRKPKLGIDKLIPDLLGLCFLSALISTITGYIMPKGQEFSEALLSRHFWSAVSLTVISGLMLIPRLEKYRIFGYWLMGILMVISGHFGGSLTHGEDYFSFSGSGNYENVVLKKDGTVYQDLILPILTKKCISCHNESKSKGGLKMHDFTNIMKGGKSGPVIVTGNPDESEIIKRLLLPHTDEHHMPPKGKSPLSDSEIAIIQFWIKNGADKSFIVGNIPREDPINNFLPTILAEQAPVEPEIPSQKPLSPSILQTLNSQGVVMIPLDEKKNLYKANLTKVNDLAIKDLKKIIPNLISVSIQDKNITKDWLMMLSNFTHLRTLQLQNCTFEKGIVWNLSTLSDLHTINFTGSNSTNPDQTQIQLPPSVRQLYLYNSNLKTYFLKELKSNNSVKIDTGGYIVPTLPTDTTRLLTDR